MLYYHHVVGTVWRLGKREMEGLQMGRNDNRLQTVQHLNPALHLLALRGLVPESLDELLSALDLSLLALVCRLKLLDLQTPLVLVERIVSAVACELRVEKLVDLVDRIVQKALVVADQKHRSPVGLQIVQKPDPGINVQIVGRLVQHHQIRVLAQDLGKGNPHLISAGELAARPFQVTGRESQTFGYGENLLLPIVIPAFEKALLQIVKLQKKRIAVVMGQNALDLMLPFEILLISGKRLLKFVIDAVVLQHYVALWKVGNPHASCSGDSSAVTGHKTCDDLHQRGLPLTVSTGKSRPGVLAYRQRDIRKKSPVTERQVNVLNLKDSHAYLLPPCADSVHPSCFQEKAHQL